MPQNRNTAAAWRTIKAGSSGAEWGIAEEVAVEIGFNGEPWTVMMATPADIADLALGLAFTEGLIEQAIPDQDMDIRTYPEGVTASITLDPALLKNGAMRHRTLDGTTGCGLCGVETLAEALRRPARPSVKRISISSTAIETAFSELKKHQPLNSATRSVHAAAWCAPDGGVLLVREDVGRHNALDKLIGALLRAGQIGDDGFIVMSSRCSFELVAKTARTNASLLATISAPTGMALDLAKAVGLELACRGSENRAVLFGGGDGNDG